MTFTKEQLKAALDRKRIHYTDTSYSYAHTTPLKINKGDKIVIIWGQTTGHIFVSDSFTMGNRSNESIITIDHRTFTTDLVIPLSWLMPIIKREIPWL